MSRRWLLRCCDLESRCGTGPRTGEPHHLQRPKTGDRRQRGRAAVVLAVGPRGGVPMAVGSTRLDLSVGIDNVTDRRYLARSADAGLGRHLPVPGAAAQRARVAARKLVVDGLLAPRIARAARRKSRERTAGMLQCACALSSACSCWPLPLAAPADSSRVFDSTPADSRIG